MSDLQVVGGGENPFAPKQRTLTSEEILSALALNPNRPMDRGRLRAIHQQLEARRGIGGRTREQELLDSMLTVQPKDPAPRVHENPARLHGGRRERRSLSLADVELVRSFRDADPKAVPPEDVKLLAELEAAAETESERRVVARVFAPIRRHHDRKEEEAQLTNEINRNTPSGFRSSRVREAWEPVLAERLAEEARAEIEPQLAGLPPDVRKKTIRGLETDAQQEAKQRIHALWAELEADATAKAKAARDRLSALALGADPQSSAIRTSGDSSMEEGRRRGREVREAREAQADAFADFRTLA